MKKKKSWVTLTEIQSAADVIRLDFVTEDLFSEEVTFKVKPEWS